MMAKAMKRKALSSMEVPFKRRKAVPAAKKVSTEELKFYDTSLAATTLPATVTSAEFDPATVLTLSAPAQGDGPSDRDGKRIVIKHVTVKGHVRSDGVPDTTLKQWNRVHIALVLDKQSNGAQENSEDVYTAPGAGALVNAFRNLQYSARFKVLASKTISFDTPNAIWDGAAVDNGGQSATFVFDKKLNLPVTFTTGTSAGIANVIDNSLHIVAFADISATPNLFAISYAARIRFVG